MARILVVSNMYPPHHYGGYELSCRDVMDRLRERGHHITVLTTTMRVPGVDDPPRERAHGVRRDLEFYWRDHVLQSPPVHRRVGMERANQRALRVSLTEAQPDVVSIWNMGAMSLGLLTTLAMTGIPLVYNVCDDWLDYGPRLDAWMRLFAGRALSLLAAPASLITGVPTRLPDIGKSGVFCFVSERTRQFAEQRTPWRYPESTVVYSGIDRRDFPPRAPGADRPWSWRLLYVGRIDDRKGIESLLRALPLLPLAELDVLGKGDSAYLSRLHDLALELGVAERVRFDSCARSELRLHYAAADAVVFPSTWDEPFGLVPVEAMACGVPVVATGRGGSAEFLVDGQNALLYPSGDHAALAAALQRLATDQSLRGRLQKGGLATATDLTIDRLTDVLEEWHLAAVDRFAHGRPAHRPRPVEMTGWKT